MMRREAFLEDRKTGRPTPWNAGLSVFRSSTRALPRSRSRGQAAEGGRTYPLEVCSFGLPGLDGYLARTRPRAEDRPGLGSGPY